MTRALVLRSALWSQRVAEISALYRQDHLPSDAYIPRAETNLRGDQYKRGMYGREMDIDALRERFLSAADKFMRGVGSHAVGESPEQLRAVGECARELGAAWKRPQVLALDELLRLNDTARLVECICAFGRAIDVARVAERMGVSDFSRGNMAAQQRDIADFGARMMREIGEMSSRILRNKALDVNAVASMLRARLETRGMLSLGPVVMKIARRYAPLMDARARDELRALILGASVDRALGVTHTPIDSARPIHEQVFTMGELVPITQSMDRDALFVLFGVRYDASTTFFDNLARLGGAVGARVIFISKPAQEAIEYDGRGLFDYDYIAANDLISEPLAGLSEKTMARFETVRMLAPRALRDESLAGVYYHLANAAEARSLIIESISAEYYRVVGAPIIHFDPAAAAEREQDIKVRKQRLREKEKASRGYLGHNFDPARARLVRATRRAIAGSAISAGSAIGGADDDEDDETQLSREEIARYLVPNESCRFLVDGQSDRADQYHRRAETAILSSAARPEAVRAVVQMYIVAKDDASIADSFRSRMTIRLRDYLHNEWIMRTMRRMDIFAMCMDSLRDILPEFADRSLGAGFIAPYFARVMRLATHLANAAEHFAGIILEKSYDKIERVLEKMIGDAADMEMFALDETLNMLYTRQRLAARDAK